MTPAFANLEAFALFWVDERPRTLCCQFADADALDHEAELFDCASCVVATRQQDLWPENLDAWLTFQRLARRLIVDLHLGAEVVRQACRGKSEDGRHDLLDRLALLYDVIYPPKTEST